MPYRATLPVRSKRGAVHLVAGRPLGSTTWSRNLVNVAGQHANVLLELWLAGAPVLELRVLLFSLEGNPKHQALVEECWLARRDERRYTVPPKIKRKLCKLASAHVTEMRCQALMHQRMLATKRDLQRQGYAMARSLR